MSYSQAYADDLTSVVEGSDLHAVSINMQRSLRVIEQWCSDKGMSVNPQKTQMVMFTHKRRYVLPPITLFSTQLTTSPQVKYLGVILDSKLLWNLHCEKACEKATAGLMQCRRIVGKSWGLKPHMMNWIYMSVIRPIIAYASIVWWPRLKVGTCVS